MDTWTTYSILEERKELNANELGASGWTTRGRICIEHFLDATEQIPVVIYSMRHEL